MDAELKEMGSQVRLCAPRGMDSENVPFNDDIEVSGIMILLRFAPEAIMISITGPSLGLIDHPIH
ncbi:hypothetical protein CY34DRAFT_802562 [Suillus luteus UH-Slu-Lm8-n1]|uniref:Uncharacterized protein n=1 Tax=Suillus luteus UH-Slu-Lm8-n1 TaxID=930992 RepID=A0A0D0A3K2_9AGAM|nr:hypothetical protein CY34DRAFT_802562 [Suillus luteus UH-Slu-Lm8-n1]